MAGKKIFLSYSRTDTEYVGKLSDELRKAGQDVWVDNKIRSGQTWDQTVENSIRDCEVIVVVMSETSVASHNVMDEVSFAIGLDKVIAPILIEDCEVPMRLARFQYIDFNQLGLDEGIKKLVSDINFDPQSDDSEDQESTSSSVGLQRRNKTTKAKRNLIIAISGVVVLLAVLIGTGVINLEDTADDLPDNLVKSATSDELAWQFAEEINTVKSFFDYSTKYPENGKFLKQAEKKLSELLNSVGYVEYSESSDDSQENFFRRYYGSIKDGKAPPKEGEYIMSLAGIDVNSSLLGNDGEPPYMMQEGEIAEVLEIIAVGNKVWCKIAYHQKEISNE